MKIVQETSSLLVLKQRNILGIIVGITFVIVGLYYNGLFFLKSTSTKSFMICLLLVIMGLLVVVFTKFQTIIFDKTVNKVSLISTGLLGKKVQEIVFGNIKEVTIEEYITTTSGSRSGGSGSKRNYYLNFYMKDGQGIPVHIDTPIILGISTADVFSGREKTINLGNKVANFIGVPFRDIGPPTATEVLSTLVDTIKDSINQHQPQPETSIPSPIQEPISKV